MKTSNMGRFLAAFVAALILAIVWGSVVQTHYNLQALAAIGTDVGAVRMSTTMRDIFGGFFPTYGGYVVLQSLLVAFVAAAWLSRHALKARIVLYALAGFAALLAGIPLVNKLAPVALLVGATRDFSCTFWMAVGGAVAGLLFALLTRVPGAWDQRPAARGPVRAGEPVTG